MTDTKVIETLDALSIEQPIIDERYQIDKRVSTNDEGNSGLSFNFEESTCDSEDLYLDQIDFYNESKVNYPLELKKADSYKTVCQKIGRTPDFCDNLWDENKQWVFPFGNREIVYSVQFKKGFNSINVIVVAKFDRDSVKQSEFVFPCDELE